MGVRAGIQSPLYAGVIMTLDASEPALVDLAPEPPFYADCITNVRVIGNVMHFAFYVEQIRADATQVERVIVRRMIMPLSGVVRALPIVMGMVPDVATRLLASACAGSNRNH